MSRLPTVILLLLRWLARPVIVFYALPWLLVLLTLGTISQRYIGLYYSEKIFFGSFILWLGPVPLPGAYTTLCILAAGLTAKLLMKSPLSKRTLGTVITHASVLLLMVGGLVSAMTREEGYITLFKDDVSTIVADYYSREMAILKNNKDVKVIPFTDFIEGELVSLADIPFGITIKQKCYPCAALPLKEPDPDAYGMAAAMELGDAQPSPDDSLNRAGVMLEISSASNKQNGRYIAFENLAKPPVIEVGGDTYTLIMRPQQRQLPFSVQLLQFEQQNHPGTAMAREYRSDIQIKDGELQWKDAVSMNQPLRYRGYTIYQSSFVNDGEKTASVLAVVKNAGWLFPYISVALLSVGLLLHLMTRMSMTSKTALPVAAMLGFFLFASPSPAQPLAQPMAQTLPDFDYTDFSHIPVLHEGRIKPLESFARALLKSMSGDKYFDNATSMAWLSEVIFDPSQAAQRPVFIIKSSELSNALLLHKKPDSRYSFSELLPIVAAQDETIKKLLQREAKTYSDSERELVHVYDMMNLYSELMGSLSLLTSIEGISHELRATLKLPQEGDVSFYTLLKVRYELMEKLKAIVASKKNNVAKYTVLEQDIAQLAYRMDTREAMQRFNKMLRVIPGEWENKEEWLSPWQVLLRSAGSPQSAKLFSLWADLQNAWKQRDAKAWNALTSTLRTEVMRGHSTHDFLMKLEVQYHALNPLNKSIIGYALSVFLALLAVAFQKLWLFRLAFASLAISIAVHSAAIVARVLILGRPPVSTLYESMLFVSLVASLCGLYLSWRKGKGTGLLAGSLVGLVVLLFADVFAGNGDTLEMLAAVLNTNFWLGTHVICITAGYGFSLITGAIAHFYLFRRAMATPQHELVDQYRLLQTLALVSLFFTTVGTMLGGIWADQSWGRFWGWDPKENGALAIVIWLVWALHGRISGHLRETAFAAVLCLTTIVVAMAWVGVNLLSVGLHSYGFSNAAAWGLPLFCAMEIVITAILAMLSAQQYIVIPVKNETFFSG